MKVQGTIIDILQVEIFKAFEKSSQSSPQSNLFSDEHHVDPDTDDFSNSVYYERSVAILDLTRTDFAQPKPMIPVQELFQGKVDELNQKVSDGYRVPVILKTYTPQEENIRVGQTVEALGFLSLAGSPQTEGSASVQDNNKMDIEQVAEVDPFLDPYYVPSIHVINIQKKSRYQDLPKQLDGACASSGQLFNIFKEYCLGDEVVAKLLMCSIASMVTKKPFGQPIDFISLNIYNVKDQKLFENIIKLYKMFAPKWATEKISLHGLGSKRFFGKKNYDLNCIEQGLVFQEGTSLLLNELNLETGTLGEIGVKNINFLNQIINHQKLYYDFNYCNFESECNVSVVDLSIGKSILEFEYRVRLELLGSF